jgi:hypothetical protein
MFSRKIDLTSSELLMLTKEFLDYKFSLFVKLFHKANKKETNRKIFIHMKTSYLSYFQEKLISR